MFLYWMRIMYCLENENARWNKLNYDFHKMFVHIIHRCVFCMNKNGIGFDSISYWYKSAKRRRQLFHLVICEVVGVCYILLIM